jgi:hypothetical protein
MIEDSDSLYLHLYFSLPKNSVVDQDPKHYVTWRFFLVRSESAILWKVPGGFRSGCDVPPPDRNKSLGCATL